MWILECIPTLLLHASHDDDLQALLKSFQIPSNKILFHHKILRNIEESRVAYIIEATFNVCIRFRFLRQEIYYDLQG